MTSRRKTKSERELVADIRKRAKLFCEDYTNGYGHCKPSCPLYHSVGDCTESYVLYLLRNMGE